MMRKHDSTSTLLSFLSYPSLMMYLASSEETTEDLRAHIHSIQETEVDQLRELTAFLDLEMNFVEQYLEVLKETKSEWAITGYVTISRSRDLSNCIHMQTGKKHCSGKGSLCARFTPQITRAKVNKPEEEYVRSIHCPFNCHSRLYR
jgi:hypothetical protein